jgi:hypothetical protein
MDRAAAVEMKGGRVEPEVVVEQLQNGAKIIETIATGYPDLEFAPVLASNSIRNMTLTILRNRRIIFRGKKVGIALIKCGDKLDSAFGK